MIVTLCGLAVLLVSTGATTDPVEVRDDPGQSYALYLPPGHAPDRPHPILYCFDPRSRGRLCLERFRPAAERLGFIVASSNNSRSDGPFEPNTVAMTAIWEDTHARFAIDDRQAYAAGFSGGSRVANVMAQVLGLTGVIGCGGGFPPSAPPRADLTFSYFGMVGETDFNYYEMRALDSTLDELELPHRLEVFDGAHQWAPQAQCGRALDWMQLRAMAEGRAEKNDSFVDDSYRRELETALGRERDGDIFGAWEVYRNAAKDFAPLRDIADATAAATRLAKTPDVRRAIRERERWDGWSRDRMQALAGFVERLHGTDLPGTTADLDVRALRRSAGREPASERALAARRILAAIFVQTSFTQVQRLFADGRYDRAAASLEVAAAIRPDDSNVWYNLACARSRSGQRAAAIRALESAASHGFADVTLLRTDPDLEAIRDSDSFRSILESLP